MITREAWDAAIQEANAASLHANDPEALTTLELALMWGCNQASARRRCLKLIDAKLAVETKKYLPKLGFRRAYKLVKGPSHAEVRPARSAAPARSTRRRARRD